MRVARFLNRTSIKLALGVIGLLSFADGCGDDSSKNAPAAADSTIQEKERAAREAAYGKGGVPTKGQGSSGSSEADARRKNMGR
jgi:hypothetical protein